MKNPVDKSVDPLFIIFEQHLLNFDDDHSDRKTFVQNVAKEYIQYLRKHQIAVPAALEPLIIEEICDQVNTMLVKKIYGCLTIDEFRKSVTPQARKAARTRYQRISRR
jgi:hypothetical protein